MTVFAGISKFERDLIHERTSAGRRRKAESAASETGQAPNVQTGLVRFCSKYLSQTYEGKHFRKLQNS